jgi:hypothetical protein
LIRYLRPSESLAGIPVAERLYIEYTAEDEE